MEEMPACYMQTVTFTKSKLFKPLYLLRTQGLNIMSDMTVCCRIFRIDLP